MITFKNFVNEAKKKPTEVEWPVADRASGFEELRHMQQYQVWKPRSQFQLFVPKRRDPAIELDNIRRNRMIRTYNELKKSGEIKEEAPPILTAFKDAPPGYNKPGSAFWTSSAIEHKNGTYSSDWYKFVKRQHSDWQTDYGYLFEIKPSAIIFDLSYAEDFYRWAFETNRLPKSRDGDDSYSVDNMRHHFPWDQLAKHFDGAHTNSFNRDDFLSGWDVESTAWFNTQVLTYRGAVKLNSSTYEDEDD